MTSDLANSARLVFRAFCPDDGPGLHALLGDPEVVEFEPYATQTQAECDRLVRERADDDRFVAVFDRGGVLVGSLWVAPEGPPHWRTWTIGYVFRRDRWGHGYATEAVESLQTALFAARNAHRVVARCNPFNVRSWHLLERTGFRREAHMREAASFVDSDQGEPIWHDSYHYAILSHEWATATPPTVATRP